MNRTSHTRPPAEPGRVSARRRNGLAVAAAVVSIGVLSSVAVAQSDTSELRPPQPEKEPEAPTFLTLASLLLLSAGLIGAAVFPSKRGHQD